MELRGEDGRASYRESLNLPTYQSERTSVKKNIMMECAYLLLEQQLWTKYSSGAISWG